MRCGQHGDGLVLARRSVPDRAGVTAVQRGDGSTHGQPIEEGGSACLAAGAAELRSLKLHALGTSGLPEKMSCISRRRVAEVRW
jgi:hypothetical protein